MNDKITIDEGSEKETGVNLHAATDTAQKNNKKEEEERHVNVKPIYIEIVEDKVRLILIDYEKCMEEKNSWYAPAGILLSIVITLCTANFESNVLLSADVIKSLFIFFGLLFLILLLNAIVRSRRCMKKNTIDEIINKMKNK